MNNTVGNFIGTQQVEAKARNAFYACIDDLEGSKAVIWASDLVGPATLLTKLSRLKERGVEKNLALEKNITDKLEVKHIIFVVRPVLREMDMIADVVHRCAREDRNRSSKRDMRIIFIPRASQMCKRRLEERGVLGSLEFKSLESDLFVFDSDLMSMELEFGYRDMVIDGDPSFLENAAIALHGLESEFGQFPHVIGRGPAAKTVADYFVQIKKQRSGKEAAIPSSIHHVILFDRQVDLLTPIATQLTYEGLIDEFFSLNNTTAQFPIEKFIDDQESMQNETKKIVLLNSSDDLYAELRDKNFNGIGPVLRRKLKTVAAAMEQRHSRNLESMKTFVSRLPELQASKKSLSIHTTIAELIKEKTTQGSFLSSLETEQQLLCGMDADRNNTFIEDSISRKLPILKILRLLCLQSLVNGGLRPRVLEYYKREIIQTYGIKFIIYFEHLEKAGLLRPMSGPRHYAALKKTFRLIIEDDSEVEPTDICFTHSLYAPLSIRLIQSFRTWVAMRDVLEMVPGPTVEHNFATCNEQNTERQRVLVFFLGGCTYAEISALRFLSQKEDSNVDYIVATSKLINGNSFLKSIIGDIESDSTRNIE